MKYNGWNAPGFKEVDCCESVDGEQFSSGMKDGCLYSAPDPTPFQRSLKHIEERDSKILRENTKGDYRPYDETETVNQG